jgi:hypothetical protein
MRRNELETIKKLPVEIAIRLAQSEYLQRLLLIDEEDIEGDFTPKKWTELIDEGYLSISPLTFEDYSRKGINSFVSIMIDELNFRNTDNQINISGQINIGTNFNHVCLKNNKLRLLEMISEIKTFLDDYKLSSAGKIEITKASAVAYSEFSFGYIIRFKTVEQERKEIDI